MKHAWLVIAHNEFEILQMLIDALDHPESDIYVHIDKKVKNIPRLRAGKSNLYVLERRLDVRWGSVSQIECELLLMSEAVRRGPYLFYHVISGTHLPLKNIDDIIQFFSDRAGSELMHLWEEDLRDIGNKLSRYNFFVRGFTCSGEATKKMSHWGWRAAQFLQKKLSVNRFRGEKFYKSDNWVSLTDPAVQYLVQKQEMILRKYRFSYCADEYFVASELMKRQDLFHVQDTDRVLKVIFVKYNPKVLTMNDYEELVASDCLFGRKFSGAHKNVAHKILEKTGVYE